LAEQFYTILTAVGKAKIANAAALGEKIELTELALGDGGGSYYNPTEDQTELRNEVWRGAIGTVAVDEENPTWITIQTVVPGQHGGFTIREAGVFDNEGDLIAVGKYPETYKPVAADGSIKDLVIRMILEVSNTASVVLRVDPTVILATQQQVNAAEARAKAYTDQEVGEVSQALAAHVAATAPHSGHETPAGAQAKVDAHANVNASTSTKGHVQLTDSVSSTSTTTAATPNSVKQAYDKANAALPKSGGSMSGELNMQDNLLTRPYIKDYAESCVASTGVSGTKTLDITTGNVFDLTLSGNTTLAFSNPSASGRACSITVIIRMPSTLYAVTWPSSVKWAEDNIPELKANKTAIFTFVTVNAGSSWYGMSAGTDFTT